MIKVTVKELREDLERLPDDTEVLMTFSYDDPDNGHFTCTLPPLWSYCSVTKKLYFAHIEGEILDVEPNTDFKRDRIADMPARPARPFYGED